MKVYAIVILLASFAAVNSSPIKDIDGPAEEFLCDLCNWFFGEIEKLVENGHTEQDVLDWMHEVCAENIWHLMTVLIKGLKCLAAMCQH